MDGEEQYNYQDQAFGDVNAKIGDLDEKQRILKDRLLLIGHNLVDTKEKTNKDILELKKDMEILQQDVKRIKDLLELISGELSKFARKEDLNILVKQAKMFQPLDFVRKRDLRKHLKSESSSENQ